MEKHLQDTSGKEGQSCSLSCQLSIPNVQAQWFKNGAQLEMKGRYTSEVKHKVQKLVIRDLRTEDQGRYTCRYQHLESSADLWVEGWYLEAVRSLTSLDSSTLMLDSFLSLSSRVLTPLLSWIILQKRSHSLSSHVRLDSNPSSPRHHNVP